MHQVGPPPSVRSWGDPLHLWLAFRFNKDPFFWVFPWGGGGQMASHDVVQDAFTSIMRDVGFHVSHEQTHVLPPPSL
jgi:hypothetical protein